MPQPNARRIATVIWAALLAGPTVFLGVALYLVFGVGGGAGIAAPTDASPGLIALSFVLSLALVAMSWLWAVRMARPGRAGVTVRGGGTIVPPGPDADALTRLILGCALCEAGALVAVVVFLLTGNTLALGPYALSWIALAAHFPGDRHWARLTGVGAPRNPMVRG